jgi:large subunit ribosomal protein L15
MLHTLPSPKTKQKMVRKGRGHGTGKGGHTVGRGTKGQKSRSGYSSPRPGFEGGQMPLSRRLPKLKGFTRAYFKSRIKRFQLKLSEVAAVIEDGKVDALTLLESGLIKPVSKKISVKILFDKEITKKLSVEGIAVSATAKAAIEKAGGEVF